MRNLFLALLLTTAPASAATLNVSALPGQSQFTFSIMLNPPDVFLAGDSIVGNNYSDTITITAFDAAMNPLGSASGTINVGNGISTGFPFAEINPLPLDTAFLVVTNSLGGSSFGPGVLEFETVNSPFVATPLPPAWPLFLTGLGVLGWRARRK